MSEMAGKVVLVTGAGQGIGRATAEAFAGEGARVLAVDIEAARVEETAWQLRGHRGAVEPFTADISRRTDVHSAVMHCVERFGSLDVLVANAGISGSAHFLELDDAAWDRVLAVNLTGTFYCLQEAARVMAPRRRG